ncbi:MAG TPA: NAD(+)--dinitrogen-reductase ADP-D-ribosyltransferase, partial [Polyangiaceae bacterium]|nr:NAD(+)--dinitrogen-reductase ADP-D-ribosyltransferase [Polyangiaceae bacterium]
SHEFQSHPRALHIVGVRRENRSLFKLLATMEDPIERAQLFDEYMTAKFRLDEWQAQTGVSRRSIRNSYLRFLRGWGFDSNSIEGAVLKGWVESRLGIAPSYHGRRIEPGRQSYLEFASQRVRGQACTNAIDAQLDLLFEFCQYELRRRQLLRITLYRGVQEADEIHTLARRGDGARLVRLNNLCSFTSEVERAWEFGSTVFQAILPAQRVFYFSGLLPKSILRGEDEYLVVGGECWINLVRC